MIFPRLTTSAAGLLFVCLATTACVETPNPAFTPAFNYNATQVHSLDASETLIVNDNSPNNVTQEFATKFNTSLDTELESWLDKRVHAAGTRGTVTLNIKDANFTSTTLDKRDGIEGYFTRDQAARWDGRISATVSLTGVGPDGLSSASFTVNVAASNTVPEKASESEKSKIYHSLVNKLITLFNQEADKQIQQNFGRFRR